MTDVNDVKKNLRKYLRAYTVCREQAAEIGNEISAGYVTDPAKEILLKAKQQFDRRCANVQIILSYLAYGGMMQRVMKLRYIDGLPMKAVADKLGYSYGHCMNVEADAIAYLAGRKQVIDLVGRNE